MNKYIIEREIPGAGELTVNELDQISDKSCSVLREMGPEIEWVESYVTDNETGIRDFAFVMLIGILLCSLMVKNTI